MTDLAVSSLLPSQAAPNLTVSRHNLVAFQLSIKILFAWQFESLRLIFLLFRLAQMTRLGQMFEMSHADFSETMAGSAGPPPSHLLRSGHNLKGQPFVCSFP